MAHPANTPTGNGSGVARGFGRPAFAGGAHEVEKSASMGEPGSHGCIRMRNADIVELFARVPVYTPVDISEA